MYTRKKIMSKIEETYPEWSEEEQIDYFLKLWRNYRAYISDDRINQQLNKLMR